MTEEHIALARRAVVCKGWRWMPGMLLADGVWQARVGERFPWREDAVLLPVLQDPATLGCLLALVREAWGLPALSLSPWPSGWEYVWPGHGQMGPCGYWVSEAEALVVALEAAP